MSESDYDTEKACLNLVRYKFLRIFILILSHNLSLSFFSLCDIE